MPKTYSLRMRIISELWKGFPQRIKFISVKLRTNLSATVRLITLLILKKDIRQASISISVITASSSNGLSTVKLYLMHSAIQADSDFMLAKQGPLKLLLSILLHMKLNLLKRISSSITFPPKKDSLKKIYLIIWKRLRRRVLNLIL